MVKKQIEVVQCDRCENQAKELNKCGACGKDICQVHTRKLTIGWQGPSTSTGGNLQDGIVIEHYCVEHFPKREERTSGNTEELHKIEDKYKSDMVEFYREMMRKRYIPLAKEALKNGE